MDSAGGGGEVGGAAVEVGAPLVVAALLLGAGAHVAAVVAHNLADGRDGRRGGLVLGWEIVGTGREIGVVLVAERRGTQGFTIGGIGDGEGPLDEFLEAVVFAALLLEEALGYRGVAECEVADAAGTAGMRR